MTLLFRKTLLSASVSLAALIAAQGAMAQEAVFVMATNEVGAPTYNPIKATMLNTPTGLLFDRLVSQAADLSYHPWLAESWEEAPDGMAWTFHLKQGVTYHNGEPFNAETVKGGLSCSRPPRARTATWPRPSPRSRWWTSTPSGS
jgi:peptide/nickel transport system substrate-binding protein